MQTLDPVEAWWMERLMDGGQLPGEPILASYRKSAENSGARFAGTETSFGIALKAIEPRINVGLRCQARIGEADDGGPPIEPRMVRAYSFPSLAECRAAFERRIGQPVEWPAE